MPSSQLTLSLFGLFCCLFLIINPVQGQSKQKDEKQISNKDWDYPVYKGCAKFKGNNKKLKNCLARKVKRHVINELDHEVFSILKTSTQFDIVIGVNKKGVFVLLKASAYMPQFKEEFIRIIETLPKIEPGKVNNQPVRVKLGLPITVKPSRPKKTNLRE